MKRNIVTTLIAHSSIAKAVIVKFTRVFIVSPQPTPITVLVVPCAAYLAVDSH